MNVNKIINCKNCKNYQIEKSGNDCSMEYCKKEKSCFNLEKDEIFKYKKCFKEIIKNS